RGFVRGTARGSGRRFRSPELRPGEGQDRGRGRDNSPLDARGRSTLERGRLQARTAEIRAEIVRHALGSVDVWTTWHLLVPGRESLAPSGRNHLPFSPRAPEHD